MVLGWINRFARSFCCHVAEYLKSKTVRARESDLKDAIGWEGNRHLKFVPDDQWNMAGNIQQILLEMKRTKSYPNKMTKLQVQGGCLSNHSIVDNGEPPNVSLQRFHPYESEQMLIWTILSHSDREEIFHTHCLVVHH